jgi:hypothetical protein
MSMTAPQHDLTRLEREFRTYRRRTGVIHLTLLALAVTAFARTPADVLRVRGLIVEDSTGAPRVVIGAPLTLAGYKSAQAGAGVAVLSSTGALQAAMGAPTPAPRIDGKVVKRIGDGAGFVIADGAGNERGGMAVFPDGRANVCLDYAKGVKEAACLVVNGGDAYSGLVVNGTPSQKAYDRLTALVNNDGTALVKIAAPDGQERAILYAKGTERAQLFVLDSARTGFKDVMPKP